ncbi:MAG: ParA family protein [Alphaproteobacteria bacterium]|nr:ParA family protein [Alphaproteobacteria bacterium]
MANIITIAQQKGGAGKTTLAAQLAVTIASRNKSIALMDIDPQGSVVGWHKMRETWTGAPLSEVVLSEVSGWRVSTEIDRLKKKYDFIIIDSPPHAETEAKNAIRAASLVLIPIQPSPMDLWATQPTLDLAKKEKTPCLLVLNRVPPRGKIVETIKGRIAETGHPCADNQLGNRTAFATSMMEGRGVVESAKSSLASQEINALADEILKTLGTK